MKRRNSGGTFHVKPGMADPWVDDDRLYTLPSGVRVRGRPLAEPASPADFCLVLTRGEPPAWPHRIVRWPDFWVPSDRADAIAAIREGYDRARAGERVEVACRGGVGRTGTVLSAFAILDGLEPDAAIANVRATYHRRAVETVGQRRWLHRFAGA